MADVWANLWHVIPEPRITLQAAATWWIHCHDSRTTCHIAGCNNSIRYIENRFSPYLFFFCFCKCSLGFDERRLSYLLRYTCLPLTTEELNAISRDVCLSVCLLTRLLKNACMDFDNILRVNRCRDVDEMINFWALTGLLSLITYALQRGILLCWENSIGKSHLQVLGARRSSDVWFWGIETPLSEVNALYRVPF